MSLFRPTCLYSYYYFGDWQLLGFMVPALGACAGYSSQPACCPVWLTIRACTALVLIQFEKPLLILSWKYSVNTDMNL